MTVSNRKAVMADAILPREKQIEMVDRLSRGIDEIYISVSEVFQRNDINGNGRYHVQYLYANMNKGVHIQDITWNMYRLFKSAGIAVKYSVVKHRITTYKGDFQHHLTELNKYINEELGMENIKLVVSICYI